MGYTIPCEVETVNGTTLRHSSEQMQRQKKSTEMRGERNVDNIGGKITKCRKRRNNHVDNTSRRYNGGRLCGLVVRVLGYRSGGPGSIPGTNRQNKGVGMERGPLSLVSTTEELLDRKVAAHV
jgi:hypothetical protein